MRTGDFPPGFNREIRRKQIRYQRKMANREFIFWVSVFGILLAAILMVLWAAA